jgi:DNA-binding response OmpR family regulator
LVTVNGERVDLTRSEFDLLAALMAAPGRVFSRAALLERVQGETAVDLPGYERTIDAHIKNLRAKLNDDPRQPRYIETVYGVGYRWCGNVSRNRASVYPYAKRSRSNITH